MRETIRSPRKCLTQWRPLVWAGCKVSQGASGRQPQRVGADKSGGGFPILLEQVSANFEKSHACARLKNGSPKISTS